MKRYHQLYKIEQAFRVSKSDLQTKSGTNQEKYPRPGCEVLCINDA
jgi:hypothetical protein